MKPVIKLSTER